MNELERELNKKLMERIDVQKITTPDKKLQQYLASLDGEIIFGMPSFGMSHESRINVIGTHIITPMDRIEKIENPTANSQIFYVGSGYCCSGLVIFMDRHADMSFSQKPKDPSGSEEYSHLIGITQLESKVDDLLPLVLQNRPFTEYRNIAALALTSSCSEGETLRIVRPNGEFEYLNSRREISDFDGQPLIFDHRKQRIYKGDKDLTEALMKLGVDMKKTIDLNSQYASRKYRE